MRLLAAVIAVAAVASPALGQKPKRLPEVCAADSPVARPCASYAGNYRIRLAPRETDKRACVVKRRVTATVTLHDKPYTGMELAAELAPLARAIGMERASLRIGAAVRDGVCCIDLDLSDRRDDRDRSVRIHVAAGQRRARAKARDRWVGDKGPKTCEKPLSIEVERL